jgi:hypothetical protein
MTANLWYLAKPVYGGWVSYTVHLQRLLNRYGTAARVLRVGQVTQQPKEWSGGIQSQLVAKRDIAKWAAGARANIVVCADKHHTEALRAVAATGPTLLVVHDPTEIKDDLLKVALMLNVRVVTIRKANVGTLRRSGVAATFVPHPYVPCGDTNVFGGRNNACAISRIDWDKQTHVIAEANEELGPCKAVDIYGALNRMYAHHRIAPHFPTWDRYYRGAFPKHWGSAVQVASGYRYMVDLSKIAGDGGGTQYTFLEAWEAGCHLVVSKAWLREEDNTMEHGVNCTAVADAKELAELLRQPPDKAIVARGYAQMINDHGASVAKKMLELAL